ncbi:MAG: nitrate reductase [Chloroflexi bacterium]|nr:nitrate reductase [Chloroflexota bacterium]
MDPYILLAEAFRYPEPGLLEQLEAGLMEIAKSPVRKGLATFVKKVGALSLWDWEELYTRTLDLSPAAAPYIGFQIWGESYQRGEFMAKLNRAMAERDIDPEGELPDHLVPILRYLAVTGDPIPDLVENFSPATQRMADILREKDKNNPYIKLFETVLLAFQSQSRVKA